MSWALAEPPPKTIIPTNTTMIFNVFIMTIVYSPRAEAQGYRKNYLVNITFPDLSKLCPTIEIPLNL